jgi:anaerobic glycerol-3-phosphate dehydrogenase
MGQNLIVMRFPAADRASQALAELKAASAAGRLQLLQAVLVPREGELRAGQGALSPAEGQRLLDALRDAHELLEPSTDAGMISLLACVREFAEQEVNSLAQELGVQVLRRPLPPAPPVPGLAAR